LIASVSFFDKASSCAFAFAFAAAYDENIQDKYSCQKRHSELKNNEEQLQQKEMLVYTYCTYLSFLFLDLLEFCFLGLGLLFGSLKK
jgi:hypothetical protein